MTEQNTTATLRQEAAAARADAEDLFRCAVRTERGRPPHHEDDISAA